MAYQAYQWHPDFVMITGDIVYDRGRISEYREKYWPIYNADEASPALGPPLLRSTVFLAVPGNHDISMRDLGAYPVTLCRISSTGHSHSTGRPERRGCSMSPTRGSRRQPAPLQRGRRIDLSPDG